MCRLNFGHRGPLKEFLPYRENFFSVDAENLSLYPYCDDVT